MSLLSFICCPAHGSRIALIKDDLMCVEVWSYSFLFERAFKIAAYLRRLLDGCGPSVVAIYGTSNPEVLSAVVGILAVPGAYMPMELDRPAATKQMLLRSHHVSAVVVELALLEDFLSQDWNLTFSLHTQMMHTGFVLAQICESLDRTSPMTKDTSNPVMTNPVALQKLLDSYSKDITFPHCFLCQETRPHPYVTSDVASPMWSFPSVPAYSLAYVLHTSGTTGEPKAVRVPHCCIVPNVLCLGTRFSVHLDDIVLNAAPLTFDPSVVEIFMALFSGSALLVVPPPLKSSASLFSQVVLMRQHVTVLQATPSLVQRLAETPLGGRLLGPRSNLRVLALGGESFPGPEVLGRWRGWGGGEGSGTRLFNVYGTTEVSSWATCQLFPMEPLASDGGMVERSEVVVGRGEVPIGEPLLGTRIELRTEEGPLEGCGWGQIWIGGVYRTCLLGDEEELVPGRMRPSGDIGYRDNRGSIYCVGRLDQQLKRAGHRVYTNTIQQVLSRSLDFISSCAVVSVKKEDIKRSGGWREIRSVASDLVLLLLVVPAMIHTAHLATLFHTIHTKIGQLLPCHCIPDDIIFVREIPISRHGKVDTRSLLDHLPSYLLPLDSSESSTSMAPSDSNPIAPSNKSNTPVTLLGKSSSLVTPFELQAMLVVLASEVLGLEAWPPSSSLLGLGADSFGITRMTNEIERQLGVRLGDAALSLPPLLGEVMMLRSLEEVVSYLLGLVQGGEERDVTTANTPPPANNRTDGEHGATSTNTRTNGEHEVTPGMPLPPPSVKRRTEGDMVASPSAKRVHSVPALLSWRRGVCLGDGVHLFAGVQASERLSAGEGVSPRGVWWGTFPPVPRGVRIVFGRRWAVDTGKCVDASPLVVCQEDTPAMVYCGSHSGMFVGVALHSGEVRWRQKLSDRVESSACVSGEFVCVGCYDGCFYVLNRHDGGIHWCFQVPSREPVKSSPAVDPATGWVWFGSHDQHLYCLDVLGKKVVFQLHLGGGSCFSSPCVAIGNRILYAATLGGAMVAVDMDVGVVLWKFQCPKPIFSSSCALPGGGVVVGCVDGSIYMTDKEGHMVGSYHTSGPVFSSCCCVTDLSPVLLGNHSASHVIEPRDQQVTRTDTAGESCDHQMTRMAPTNRSGALCHNGVPTTVESHSIGPRYHLYCGSHDKCVYCWDDQLHLVWKREMASEVYSVPFQAALVPDSTDHSLVDMDNSSALDARRLALCSHRVPCLCVCTVSGQVSILHAVSGAVLGRTDLPGPVYSSPVLVDGLLVVGCRDNNLYCMSVAMCSN